MSERELLEHANRALGFKSLGAQIRTRLEQALGLGVSREELLLRDGVVRLP